MSNEITNPIVEKSLDKDSIIDLGENIVLCQCFSCKKNYVQSLMKPISIKKEEEEGYVTCKRYLCDQCMESLQRTKWVQEEDFKRKKEDE